MQAEAAVPPAAVRGPVPVRDEVDRRLLPELRERLRDCLWFLALSQGVYVVVLFFSHGDALVERMVLNGFRLVVLLACIHALRREITRRRTLTVASIALAVQLLVGIAISVVRHDVIPMSLLTIALTCVTSALVPWGLRSQLVLSVASAVSLLVASALVSRTTGQHLGLDPAATLLATFAITAYIAHFLDRSRRDLKARLAEARRTDEELSALRAELERRVTERTAELEMANRELEGFSYTVSHDLRSPLRTIGGFSQMILDDTGNQLDESSRGHLDKIREASRRMDGLIDDMLLLARVGRSALRYESIDLAAMARSIGDELAAEQPDRNIALSVGPIPAVPGDHALLRIALDNLLRNAWKFTAGRRAAHVSVTGETIGDRVVLRVHDDGIGFDPRFRHKLFQPFERIHGDPRFPGSGVGLATVARIVRRHGGEVDAQGVPDGGATFSIRLPAKRTTEVPSRRTGS